MEIVRLLYSLPGNPFASPEATQETQPPTEFLIFPFGLLETTKGEFLFDEESAKSVMEEFADHGNRLTMDYEHQALADPPVEAPMAASYLLELRANGLWAIDVRWTPRATKMLRDKEYLYFSPAFTTQSDNRPRKLLNLALTNLPASKRMQALVAANQLATTNEESNMKTVLSALSLKETASEADALSVIVKLSDEHRRLLSATSKKDVDEAIGFIMALKDKADKAEALSRELKTSQEELEKLSVDRCLDVATVEGRIAPSEREKFEGIYRELGFKALSVFISERPKKAAPAVMPKSETRALNQQAVNGVTAEELQVCSVMHQKPEDLVAHKAWRKEQLSRTAQFDHLAGVK